MLTTASQELDVVTLKVHSAQNSNSSGSIRVTSISKSYQDIPQNYKTNI